MGWFFGSAVRCVVLRPGLREGAGPQLLRAFQSAAERYGGDMKRLAPLVLALCCAVLFADSAPAAEKKEKAPGIELATMASQVTGIAISPLLGVSGVGAYQYFKASTPEEKAQLPWFAQVSFWLPALLLVGVCAIKDTFAAMMPPGMKKPLDVAEPVENKI